MANEASDQVSSYSSSANSSKNADAAGASTVSEGGSITVDDEGYLIAEKPFQEPVGPSFWEREK